LEGAVDRGLAFRDELPELVGIDGKAVREPANTTYHGTEVVVFVVLDRKIPDLFKRFGECGKALVPFGMAEIRIQKGFEARVSESVNVRELLEQVGKVGSDQLRERIVHRNFSCR
jgi:hypothetical protein